MGGRIESSILPYISSLDSTTNDTHPSWIATLSMDDRNSMDKKNSFHLTL